MFSTLRNGQYQFLNKLGTGGMGDVYQARDTRLNRLVAVKVLKAEVTQRPDSQRRFMQEAQSASSLNHPNIITIYDIFSEGGADLMIMEYVAGKTLVEVIPKGGLRTPLVLNYAVQMADALAAAHAAGIVHRDLKPGNIMVTDSGLVKILDFGLAKLVTPSTNEDPDATIASNPLTVEGTIIGTVAYMSPEQAQGKRVDLRSDIFAFGAVVYEMTTGRRAFEGSDAVTTLTAVLRDEAPAMSEVAPDVPPQLDAVIQKCLRKNPDDRWQSMKDVWQELMILKQNSDTGTLYRSRMIVPPAPEPATDKPAPAPAAPKKKSKAPLLVGVLALLAAVAGGVWFATQRGGTETPAATEQAAKAPEAEPVNPPASPADKTLANDDVLEMVKEKVSTPLIISQIRASKSDFKLTPQEVIRLVKGGVPDSVIEVMRDPKKPLPGGALPPPPGSMPPPPPPKPVSESAQVAVNPTPVTATSSPKSAPAPGVAVVKDATPLQLSLQGQVPEDANEGLVMNFVVLHDVKVDNVVVIAKGAHALGEIYEAGKKRKLLGRSKMTYRMNIVQSVDGRQLRLRATPGAPKAEDVSRRPVLPPGTQYLAYIDGDASISPKP